MKANAPEKIYRTTTYLDNDKGKTLWKKQPVAGAENIKYIRADAFIEKACKWLDNRGCLYVQYSEGGTSFNNKQFIGDFKKAMKGE